MLFEVYYSNCLSYFLLARNIARWCASKWFPKKTAWFLVAGQWFIGLGRFIDPIHQSFFTTIHDERRVPKPMCRRWSWRSSRWSVIGDLELVDLGTRLIHQPPQTGRQRVFTPKRRCVLCVGRWGFPSFWGVCLDGLFSGAFCGSFRECTVYQGLTLKDWHLVDPFKAWLNNQKHWQPNFSTCL